MAAQEAVRAREQIAVSHTRNRRQPRIHVRMRADSGFVPRMLIDSGSVPHTFIVASLMPSADTSLCTFKFHIATNVLLC